MNKYQKIKVGAGAAAAVATVAYGVWAIIAAADGRDRGVEIPNAVAIPVVGAIVGLALTSFLVQLAERVVCRVVESLISDGFALLVSGVDAKLRDNNKHLHKVIKEQIAHAVEEAHASGIRAGIVIQAQATAAAANAENSDATVTRIRNAGR